jgi:hypothetical protein
MFGGYSVEKMEAIEPPLRPPRRQIVSPKSRRFRRIRGYLEGMQLGLTSVL